MTEAGFVNVILSNPVNSTVLDRLDQLALPDAWLVSGALFQTVWNAVAGRDPAFGIKDYDVFYFDADTSWSAEDVVIKHAAATFADVGSLVEVRNQARVHLWYPDKFGVAYPAATRATDGIDRFLMRCAQVGI